MPAPATNQRVALTLLLLAACASNPPEPGVAATPSAAQETANLDRYTPPPPVSASPVEALADLETSLAAYEAQLAENEARLQAMGVRIARAEPIKAEAADDRFAPPPPARPGDAPMAGATSRPAPAPTPTQPSKRAEEKNGRERVQAKKTASPSGAGGDAPRTKAPRSDSSRDAADEAQAADKDRGGRCADLCDLAAATCDLEAKICDLAARHQDEPRYAEVCQRASDDCRAAADACTLCSP